ncbi:FAD binding domain-containing protein [Seiridium cupressi]
MRRYSILPLCQLFWLVQIQSIRKLGDGFSFLRNFHSVDWHCYRCSTSLGNILLKQAKRHFKGVHMPLTPKYGAVTSTTKATTTATTTATTLTTVISISTGPATTATGPCSSPNYSLVGYGAGTTGGGSGSGTTVTSCSALETTIDAAGVIKISVPKSLPGNARLLRDAGLGHRILVPSDADYGARVDSYWSSSAKLKPDCILHPKTAEEVAKAIKPLAAANERFAIRSGGHTNWAGSNNIESGITIDLSALNATIFSPDLKTATIGPGRHGFACDNVIAYEVVLADGRIITADAQSHADLFRSLKGGSSNFGIVTNFTMKTIACDRVWGGMTFYPNQVIPQAIEALCAFAGNVRNDPDSNLVTMFTTWFTASFRNDTRIVVKASELHDQLVEELKETVPDGNFIKQCLFQPLPTLFAENSSSAGGNIMGVEQHSHDGLIFLATAILSTVDHEALACPKVKLWVETVKKYAATIDGGNLEWTYLNYADKSQDPLRSYGEENVRMMKTASANYDPQRVFQKLCPGGFKISSVELE